MPDVLKAAFCAKLCEPSPGWWLFRHQTSVLDRIRNGSLAFWSAIRRLCNATWSICIIIICMFCMFMRWYWAQFSILTSPSPAAWQKKDSKCLKSLPVLQVPRPSGVSRSSSISRACLFQHLSLGSRPCEKHVMLLRKFAELAAFLLQYLDPCLHSPSLFGNFITLHLPISDHKQLQLQLRVQQ